MKKLRLAPVFLSAMAALGGCVNTPAVVQPAQSEPRDPCLFAPRVCGEVQVNTALIAAATEVEKERIQAASGMLVRLLVSTKDPVLLAKLHNNIYERINSEDERIRNSQLNALSEAGVDADLIRPRKKPVCTKAGEEKGVIKWDCNYNP